MGIRAAARHHAGGVRCLGCGATVPDDVGPIHAYMTAAPGCWARYCLLEDWKASLSGEEAIGVVCDLVDCFAVQHATNPERRNRQSVGVHLMSLCSALERSASERARRERLSTWVGRDYPLLEPSPSSFALTVSDVVAAPAAVRALTVERMAEASWAAWSAHHETVRAFLDDTD